MASPAPPISDHQAWPPLLSLTDDILEEIFLRLPTPTDLARACTARASFRRIITARSFLRRFRALHPPPLLGFVACEEHGFYPAEPPYPSAPLARAVAGAADFSYSFVPEGKWNKPWSTWIPCDVRQGRVLLQCCRDPNYTFMAPFYVELAVCDPMFRRYVLLPPIPRDLVAQHGRLSDLGLLLAPTGEDEKETSFRVMCLSSNNNGLVAFAYSSVTGHWCIAASATWGCLGTVAPVSHGSFSMFDYSQGCTWRERSLVLDTMRMQFSIVQNVPYHLHKLDTGVPLIVVGTEGTPEMFFLSDSFDLLHFHVMNRNEPSDKWQLKNTIPLPSYYIYYLTLGAAEGFLFLRGIPKNQGSVPSLEHPDDYCVLDAKTSKLEKVCGIHEECFFRLNAYFGFPPSLSKPCA